MQCKICNQPSARIFTTEVLLQYQVSYYQCSNCQFIQTENPYWLPEAYKEAISTLDIGYLTRNLLYTDITEKLISNYFNPQQQYLDYGGGYGMFVRLMRDRGYRFYRQDSYCENLFARFLDITDLDHNKPQQFELLTAFEVFEHLVNPLAEIEKMFSYSNSILFSTELQPHVNITSPADWWYFVPETGQHIALFSKNALLQLCKQFSCNLYSNGSTLHLLTKHQFKKDPVQLVCKEQNKQDLKLQRHFSNPKSLIQFDFEQAKQKLNEKKQ
jgi:hypothetical protein